MTRAQARGDRVVLSIVNCPIVVAARVQSAPPYRGISSATFMVLSSSMLYRRELELKANIESNL